MKCSLSMTLAVFAVALLALASPAASQTGTAQNVCANTVCNSLNNYYPVPLSSPNHPSVNPVTCSTCTSLTQCTLKGSPTTFGDCAQCCYQRTCSNSDGLGTPYCPYGYDQTSTLPINDTAIAAGTVFASCCTAPAPGSFPLAQDSIPGYKQAMSLSDMNWGFDEGTSNLPFVSNKGRFTGMCFKISSTYDCDSTTGGECCNPSAKPAFLQFKLPVTGSFNTSDISVSPRAKTLTRLQRCRLAYGRTTSTAINRMNWKFTDFAVAASSQPGDAANDARYATIPLSFGLNREVTMCLYTGDFLPDLDCSWENICGLIPTDPNYVGGQGDNLNGRPENGCEIRLIGHRNKKIGNTVTSKCVGLTYSISDYTSTQVARVEGTFSVVPN